MRPKNLKRPDVTGMTFSTEATENEAAISNLKLAFMNARKARGTISLTEALLLCESANKEFSRGTPK